MRIRNFKTKWQKWSVGQVIAVLVCFPWHEKLLAPLIATPNEDTQFEDKVTKGRKGKIYATGYIRHSFVTNWKK